jgi:hypothetical protein
MWWVFTMSELTIFELKFLLVHLSKIKHHQQKRKKSLIVRFGDDADFTNVSAEIELAESLQAKIQSELLDVTMALMANNKRGNL